MPRKTHQTTLRFSDDMWDALGRAAARRDVSIAQYVRDAAQARLDAEPKSPSVERLEAAALGVDAARNHSFEAAESTTALWEQGRLARERSAALRAQSREQRLGTGGWREQSESISRSTAALWEKGRVARERAQLLREAAREFDAERGG